MQRPNNFLTNYNRDQEDFNRIIGFMKSQQLILINRTASKANKIKKSVSLTFIENLISIAYRVSREENESKKSICIM